MMCNTNMGLVASLCEKGFSLDELVVRTKELFETKGMSGFVAFVLMLVDEEICKQIMQGLRAHKCCCEKARYELAGKESRRIRTSIGEVELLWKRLRCTLCGKSFVPLRDFLGLERYRSKSSELEKLVAEVVSEQSYRRSSSHLDLIGEIPVPKSTAHRWVMESDCDELDIKGVVVESLFADGTGYKRKPDEAAGQTNRGELRVVMGIHKDGTVVPYGAWSGSSWEEIAQELRAHTIKRGPLAKVLISDGESAIADALADLVTTHQRCHWHGVHDLDHALWEDGASKAERCDNQKRMAGIIGIELPEEDFERVSNEDKQRLEASAASAEQSLQDFVGELRTKGYETAARYVANASSKLFTYVRLWLKTGLVCARASSMIERMMRELGRRLKKIGHGWKEAGAAKMARIIIKRITSANQWDAYWREKLRLLGKVILVYRGVTAQ